MQRHAGRRPPRRAPAPARRQQHSERSAPPQPRRWPSPAAPSSATPSPAALDRLRPSSSRRRARRAAARRRAAGAASKGCADSWPRRRSLSASDTARVPPPRRSPRACRRRSPAGRAPGPGRGRAATPVRMPVKLPGPTVTASRSSCGQLQPASASTASTSGRMRSAWPRWTAPRRSATGIAGAPGRRPPRTAPGPSVSKARSRKVPLSRPRGPRPPPARSSAAGSRCRSQGHDRARAAGAGAAQVR